MPIDQTNKAFHAVVFGRVQLVMYRDFVQRKARGLGVVGEVKNMNDGTVSVTAEGKKDALERLVVLLNKGSLLSRVVRVIVEWQEPTGRFSSFSINYQ